MSITENIHLPLDFSGSRYCTVPQEYQNLQEFLQSYGLKQLWASIFLIFLDTKCKLHVFQHQSKSSNVLCTFNIRSVSRGIQCMFRKDIFHLSVAVDRDLWNQLEHKVFDIFRITARATINTICTIYKIRGIRINRISTFSQSELIFDKKTLNCYFILTVCYSYCMTNENFLSISCLQRENCRNN